MDEMMKRMAAESADEKEVPSVMAVTRETVDLLCEVERVAERLWYRITGEQFPASPETMPANNMMDDMKNNAERALCILQKLNCISDVLGVKG